jgi:hypothetical protein
MMGLKIPDEENCNPQIFQVGSFNGASSNFTLDIFIIYIKTLARIQEVKKLQPYWGSTFLQTVSTNL